MYYVLGSNIYYYDARRTKKFNYPAPGTAFWGGLGKALLGIYGGKGGVVFNGLFNRSMTRF